MCSVMKIPVNTMYDEVIADDEGNKERMFNVWFVPASLISKVWCVHLQIYAIGCLFHMNVPYMIILHSTLVTKVADRTIIHRLRGYKSNANVVLIFPLGIKASVF